MRVRSCKKPRAVRGPRGEVPERAAAAREKMGETLFRVVREERTGARDERAEELLEEPRLRLEHLHDRPLILLICEKTFFDRETTVTCFDTYISDEKGDTISRERERESSQREEAFEPTAGESRDTLHRILSIRS